MVRFFKVLAWIIILGIIGWIIFSIVQGNISITGKAIYVPATGSQAPILKFADCVDTDGGKMYREKGHTYNVYDNAIYDDYCDGDGVIEYFCNNQYPDRIKIPCDCFKGACI